MPRLIAILLLLSPPGMVAGDLSGSTPSHPEAQGSSKVFSEYRCVGTGASMVHTCYFTQAAVASLQSSQAVKVCSIPFTE